MIFLSKNHLTFLLAYHQSELEAVEKGIDLKALEIAIEVLKKRSHRSVYFHRKLTKTVHTQYQVKCNLDKYPTTRAF